MKQHKQTKESGLLEKVSDFTDKQTTHLGETIESANETVADLKEQAEAGYREKVSPALDAAQVEIAGASRYLQEQSVNDFLTDLENYARRHPRITAAVGAILGWKLGRALSFNK